MSKKVWAGIFLCFVLGTMIFLLLQSAEDTVALSNMVREWFKKVGYNRSHLEFRSDVHIIEYFIIAIAMITFGFSMKWKWYVAPLLTNVLGLTEEIAKIFLPTREFGVVDLLKDCIGTWVAILFVYGIILIKKKMEAR